MKKWPLVVVAGAAAVAATGYAYRKPIKGAYKQLLEDAYQAAYAERARRTLDERIP